ncbi:transmembrane amino acid transporter protein [Dictyocaulus viviparus]|uniref:Transmembrane amino acid transporter protein n=1 Tax=Dictyocaulus viviparus TaxID=29172 RepID=A0A0D8XEU3_DICVI|nr:transmembrane amino acid transporter protein [Dictyocaulus viviparus]
MKRSSPSKDDLTTSQPLLFKVQSDMNSLKICRTQQSTVVVDKANEEVQSSIVTIFTIWNSMMGVSILSIPWGIHQAGLFFGLSLLIFMGIMSFYTAYLITSSQKQLETAEPAVYELSDVCRILFGRVGEIVAVSFSILVLIGVVLAYWVLMSNFLYFTGKRIHELITFGVTGNSSDSGGICGTYCDAENTLAWLSNDTTEKAGLCGAHCDFIDSESPQYIEGFSWNFPALTGMLTMSYFIHNTILGIFRCQRNPENNARDLCVAYGLVLLTYIFIALTFYVTFPLSRDCIQDNLLNNFHADYALSSIARVLIFFQCFTIFPLIAYFIRSQISCMIYNNPWPGIGFVVALNAVLVISGVCVAIFYPNVGAIVRYFGAAAGVIIVYTLPCLIYMKLSHTANSLTIPKIVFHSCIIIFGIANVIGQLLV